MNSEMNSGHHDNQLNQMEDIRSRAARRLLQHSMRRQRIVLDRANPLEYLRDDKDVKARFKFRHATVYSILRMIKDDLERQTKRSCALPPLLQLCVSLQFFC